MAVSTVDGKFDLRIFDTSIKTKDLKALLVGINRVPKKSNEYPINVREHFPHRAPRFFRIHRGLSRLDCVSGVAGNGEYADVRVVGKQILRIPLANPYGLLREFPDRFIKRALKEKGIDYVKADRSVTPQTAYRRKTPFDLTNDSDVGLEAVS